MSFDLFPNEQGDALANAARHPSYDPSSGAFTNFLPGAASYGMRSLAEVGRAIDMAGSVFPIAADAVTGGTERQDQYFKEHDDVFNGAVDHWTPRPGEVGMAGQIAGQLAGGVLQATISPALLVGTSQLATGEDLVRQGVDAGPAGAVGALAGTAAAVGLKIPFLGKSLATRVLSGAGGNVALGAATAGASNALLSATGNPQQAAQFDATDVRARVLDALMGAAFGGLAHVGAKLSPGEDAAILVANQARHLEDTTRPGAPVADTDLTQHVAAIRQAVDQVLRGDPVAVDKTVEGMRTEPDPAAAAQRSEMAAEMVRAGAEQAPAVEPIRPIVDDTPMRSDAAPAGAVADGQQIEPTVAAPAPAADLMTTRVRAALKKNPDMMIPDRALDPLAEPAPTRAADVMARVSAERADAQATAPDVFRTAAACLLGVL